MNHWLFGSPRRIAATLGIIGLATAMALAGTYLFMSNTAAYREAAKFAATSPAVRDRAGNVTSVWLDPTGYKMAWWGNDGYAIFSVGIGGESGHHLITVLSFKSAGRWVMAAATMNNQALEVPVSAIPALRCVPSKAAYMQVGSDIDPLILAAAGLTPCP